MLLLLLLQRRVSPDSELIDASTAGESDSTADPLSTAAADSSQIHSSDSQVLFVVSIERSVILTYIELPQALVVMIEDDESACTPPRTAFR